jgi:tubulin polyglutamylase TTLL6/13
MDVGHKRSLTSVFKLIEKRGFNLASIKKELHDAIIKTLLLGHPLVAHQYRFCQPEDEMRNMCFHILGIDVMLDENCKPFVVEVNHTPSFVTDTPLDYHIKFSLIKDTLVLMNINQQSRAETLERMSKLQKEKAMKRQKRQLY